MVTNLKIGKLRINFFRFFSLFHDFKQIFAFNEVLLAATFVDVSKSSDLG